MLQVCRGLACSINGAEDIMAYFREKLGVGHLETTPDGLFSYEEVECLAACDRATCMQVNLEFVYDLTPQKIDEMLDVDPRRNVCGRADGADRQAGIDVDDRPGREISMGTKSAGRARRSAIRTMPAASAIASGVIMLDRFVNKQVYQFTGTTERAVVESRAVVDTVDEESARCRSLKF